MKVPKQIYLIYFSSNTESPKNIYRCVKIFYNSYEKILTKLLTACCDHKLCIVGVLHTNKKSIVNFF